MLKLAVTGDDDRRSRPWWPGCTSSRRPVSTPMLRLTHPAVPDPGAHHLVVGVTLQPADQEPDDLGVDVWVSGPADGLNDLDGLWQRRLAPFAHNLAKRRRAPRRRMAALLAPDPSWPVQAGRLMARIASVAGDRAQRIDHIGSTAVPGMLGTSSTCRSWSMTWPSPSKPQATPTTQASSTWPVPSTASTGTETTTTSRSRSTPTQDGRSMSISIPLPHRYGGRCCCCAIGFVPRRNIAPSTPPSNRRWPRGPVTTSTTSAATRCPGSATPCTARRYGHGTGRPVAAPEPHVPRRE